MTPLNRHVARSVQPMRADGRCVCLRMFAAVIACSGVKRFYLHTELPKLESNDALAIAPGPWPEVPAVVADAANVPDDLVLPTLKALMELPGAANACDSSSRRPRSDASEYCVAFYRTPEDWRVSWPIRNTTRAADACSPPFGGVDDMDFGRDLPVFGYAHNHPCGTDISGQDLSVWPFAKVDGRAWIMVAYGTTPSGRMARDSRGQLIPAWGWLATGHPGSPRFFKWSPAGDVFRWDDAAGSWKFEATCRPRPPSSFRPQGSMPDCTSPSRP